MIIIFTKEQLTSASSDRIVKSALEQANKFFDGNICFKRFDYIGGSGLRMNVTLTVHDSRKPGSRRGFQGQRVSAACWHAYGRFIDALPKGTEIRSLGKTSFAGDRWHDWNCGSIVEPRYMSEMCDC